MPTGAAARWPRVSTRAARRLLRQTGVQSGDILLVTDSEVADADVSRVARPWAGEGYRTSVLAVGTEQGAPIPQPEGGFVNDANGQVVIPQVDIGSLRRLANAGRGRFRAACGPTIATSRHCFPAAAGGPLDVALGGGRRRAEVPGRRLARSRRVARALRCLPLLALFVPPRLDLWLAARADGCPCHARRPFEWNDLWLRRDQARL